MKIFEFTVVVDNLDINDMEMLEALFTDEFIIVPASSDGKETISVEIEAMTGDQAIQILEQHLSDSATGVTISYIDPDLVNIPDIAERLNVNRETVRIWCKNQVKNEMPSPWTSVGVGKQVQKIWFWHQIYSWAVQNKFGKVDDLETVPLDPDIWDSKKVIPKAPSIATEWNFPDKRVVVTISESNKTNRPVLAARNGRILPGFEHRNMEYKVSA